MEAFLMHTSVMSWAQTVLTGEVVSGRTVLEAGSYNVNGSVRGFVTALGPASYVGVDQTPGPGVDVVADCERLAELVADRFDVVVTTEMLEHVVNWQPCIANLVEMLAPGGLLVVTTRGPGFPYHPHPVDTWRYTVDGFAEILAACGLTAVTAVPDPDWPGVFATARRPLGWSAPWPSPAEAALPSEGVTPMVAP